ncbi:MAG: hypothetical protein LLG37_02225 [Spirochaetia bacterium]|nr:hypothetical protein [Spirochaetia bacterium]
MRTFVGIPLTDDIKHGLSAFIRRWQGIKDVEKENLHMTPARLKTRRNLKMTELSGNFGIHHDG